MAIDTKDIRNVVVLGHSGSGKTALVEHLLYLGGAIPKAGAVETGNTVSDYNEDEVERKISINSSVLHVIYKGVKINIIDTPGFNDFIGEVYGALEAADAAILVVSSTSGVEMGTERFHKMIKERNLPFLIYVSREDKEHADFKRCMEQITRKFGKHCCVVDFPIGEEASFKGDANFITKENIDKIDPSDKDIAKTMADTLMEEIAESDDALLEKFLNDGELPPAESIAAYDKAVKACKLVPVIAGSSAKDYGVPDVLQTIIEAFPSPLERPAREAMNQSNNQKVNIEPNAGTMFSAQVFKTISDPYLGQISVMKIMSGKAVPNQNVLNASQGAREKFGAIFMLNGKKDTPVDELRAGDIVCVAKLKTTVTGDTLTDEKNNIVFPRINFPEPAISFSIKPKSRNDEDKISNALHKLAAEDNAFKSTRDPQTRELIVSGMGDLHLNIIINRLAKRFGVQVDIGTPKVAYKETIMSKADAMYRHKKQSGGAGQFGEVWLKVEPMPRGAGFEFVDDVVGGAIPQAFVVSCEKGVKTALDSGFLAGFPVVDVRATVYDGKTHPVDSKDIAFQIAARHAFKDACSKAKPALLEPIMDVDFLVPDECMGDVTGSLNQRRGRVIGMEPGDGSETIKAQVPLDEMYKYVNELKSITAGRGTYTMRFSHYEVVPSNIAQNIVAHAQKNRVQEKEEE